MNRSQRIAVTSGIVGFLISFLNPLILFEVSSTLQREKPAAGLRFLLFLLLVYIGPAFVIAFGTYHHSVGGKKSGFILVTVGAVILIAELPFLLVTLPYSFFVSDWLQRTFLAFYIVPNILAISALVASILERARLRTI